MFIRVVPSPAACFILGVDHKPEYRLEKKSTDLFYSSAHVEGQLKAGIMFLQHPQVNIRRIKHPLAIYLAISSSKHP